MKVDELYAALESEVPRDRLTGGWEQLAHWQRVRGRETETTRSMVVLLVEAMRALWAWRSGPRHLFEPQTAMLVETGLLAGYSSSEVALFMHLGDIEYPLTRYTESDSAEPELPAVCTQGCPS